MSAQTDLVLGKLEGVKPAGSGKWMAKCPGGGADDDRQASLSIREGATTGASCSTATPDARPRPSSATSRSGWRNSSRRATPGSGEKFLGVVAEYDYRDESGKLLYQAVRLSPKSFRQRRPAPSGGWDWKLEDTRRVLFRLPELIAAAKDAIVWVTEGEKDVLALVALGLVATTNVGGAGKWKSEYSGGAARAAGRRAARQRRRRTEACGRRRAVAGQGGRFGARRGSSWVATEG